ncbi:MAG: hypothetical protein SVO26_00990 [Chloroflexota bacterium]|nr:hypothetical protein [Chloroflexota bacterium]
MSSVVVFAAVLVSLVILLPVVYAWYLNIGGIYYLGRGRERKLVCSTDTECPSGYICRDGFCVPLT